MELSNYLRVLRRNWQIIVASLMLGLLTAAGVSMLVKPTYTSSTQLFVAIQGSGTVSELQQGNSFTQARVESYAETAVTPSVLQPVIDKLGLNTTSADLKKSVKATSDLKTVIISIAVVDTSPAQAAAIAQAVADSLVSVIDKIERPAKGGDSPVKLSVVTPASAPTMPSAPDTRLYLALGAVIGLALGVGVAVLRAALDTKIRGEADLRRVTDSPILGGISFDGEVAKRPLLGHDRDQSQRAESFRQIRTNLQFAAVSKSSRAVLVTSSLPGEGKSTTAINLAISMAQAGQTVVLVDADLRRPQVDQYLGLERNAGLTTALIGEADINDVLQPWGSDEMYVLTSGLLPPNPSELLGSVAMKALIERLELAFDAVIIDSPPLLPVTDAAVLAQQVGGVVVVVGSSSVRTPDLEKSLGALEMVNADLLGIVMNLMPTKGPDAYAYSYSGYESKQDLPLTSSTKALQLEQEDFADTASRSRRSAR